ncbi:MULTISPECIES: hypothetical protein [Microbacterium]|uniref:hypothetical protein n=1 Tax=Microbacterium TaxID=33882 RepID=UPI001B7CEFFB|nr:MULTISPECIES: hypothetical protein [Microbacterium]
MPDLNDRVDDELRALRERAYGPGADIHDDPVALARLDELERSLSGERPSVAVTPRDPVDPDEGDARTRAEVAVHDGPADPRGDPADPRGDPADPRDDPVRSSDEPAPPADPASAEPARPASRLSRRTKGIWAVSVVAALIAGAALTMATTAAVGGRVAVLAEADLDEWPDQLFGEPQEGAQVFEELFGLRVLTVPNAWGSSRHGINCVFVTQVGGSEAGSAGELITTGCGDGHYPPSAAFPVTDASPEALRERFPIGTSLKVVVQGNQAEVFARTP